MCSPRNTGNINVSLWLTGGLSQGCPDFQKVYVFKVYVSFSCPIEVRIMFQKWPHHIIPKDVPIDISLLQTGFLNSPLLHMGKIGSICHFPRALPASIWGHCSQALVFTSIWGTQKGCDNDIFRAVCPNIWVSWDPQTLQNKGKRKMTNRPCFTPTHSPLLQEWPEYGWRT